ncbi:hypothetical protein D2V17_00060 [Aurantiacibacter xanthus]|uniref:PepSY domain-containing protein n=1 Tax=Aurantiacibacter xanthus TaxID=1784712 RepID=A0A3A1PKB2_9SPHN|nr:hypothetical protein [Aurantiacibacter xanthus]RIV93487.1 hypothetical protein D2V17_00060 [Aurantiacibacter xanthus]
MTAFAPRISAFAAASALALAGAVLAVPAAAQPVPSRLQADDQASARAEMQAGRNLPIRAIEQRIVPRYERQGFEYLTFEYDGVAAIYRLKFIKDGRLLFVDADPRSGRVLREQR